jgi:uncharacterized membrane protein YfcA
MTAMKLGGVGVAAGFFGALFGVGGGVVIVPLLVAVLGFGQRRASATSLAAILISSLAGAATYALHGEVRPGAAAIVGIRRCSACSSGRSCSSASRCDSSRTALRCCSPRSG